MKDLTPPRQHSYPISALLFAFMPKIVPHQSVRNLVEQMKERLSLKRCKS